MMKSFSRVLLCGLLQLSVLGPLAASAKGTEGAAVAERLIKDALRSRTERPAHALVTLQQAIALLKRPEDLPLRLQALRAKRDLELEHAAYDAALRTNQEILGASASNGDRAALADDLLREAEAHDRTEGADLAVDAAKRSLLIRRATGDSLGTAQGYLRLLELLYKAERYAEFKRSYAQALEACPDEPCASRAQLLLGRSMIAQKKPADALPVLLQALRKLDNGTDQSILLQALLAIAEAECQLGLWEPAQLHLDRYFTLVNNGHGRQLDHQAFSLRSRVAEGHGDIRLALTEQRRQFVVRDSLLKANRAERMASLQALYTLQKEQRDLEDLRQGYAESTHQLERERDRGRWGYAMIGLLSIGMLFLVVLAIKLRRTMLRERAKGKVIRRQSEEIRLKNQEMERRSLRLTELAMSDEEKEMQLKEIHHRVKNNLQIVSALLRMQGATSKDQRYAELMRECQGRLHAMAMVHEHIYIQGDMSRVNVKAHLLALADSVVRNHGIQDRVMVDVRSNYERATLDELIPLSLLLNELITNSVRYAFEGRLQGTIRIDLKRNPATQECELLFSDDGIGLCPEVFSSKDSFGLELVRALALQLNGTLQLLTGEGTALRMLFRPDEPQLRKAS